MNDSQTVSTLSPEEAFSLLGNETRVAIVRELGKLSGESVSFSALRDRVAVADSGQFNYHLKKLVGSFVTRTDEGEYELTYAGARIVGAIHSGTYNQRGTQTTFDLDSTCPVCESPLSVEYENERVTISCPICEDQLSRFGFPPGAFESRTREELTRAFDGWIRTYLSLAATGFCLNCAGRMHGSLTDDSEYMDENQDVCIEYVCERCVETATTSVRSYLVHQPAVVAFHHDHGINLTETPSWELPWLRDEQTDILSRDPWRVKAVVTIDDDRLECVVNEDLSVSIL